MKTRLLLSLAFISFSAFYFISLSPSMTDNYIFSRFIHPGYASFYAGAPVSAEPLTIANALAQAKDMYFTWCGRFMGNLAVYFMFMLPHWLYCLAAALTFALYIILLQVCIFGRNWRGRLTAGWTLGVAALIWLGMPSFGDAFLWPSVGGQAALLGQALIFLPFRFALDAPYEIRGLKRWIYGILGVMAGGMAASLDYATSAALPPTALLFSGWLFHKWRKLPFMPLCLTLGLCIGAALTLGAPGNAARLSITSHAAVQQYLAAGWLERTGTWLAHLPGLALDLYVPLILLAWGLLALCKAYGKSFYKYIPVPALLFFVPACLTVGAYLFTAWPPARGFSTVFVQLLICSCIVYVTARPFATARLVNVANLMRRAMIFVCIALLAYEGFHFYSLAQLVEMRQNIISAAKEGIARLPEMPKNSGDRYWALGSSQNDISADPSYYVNRAMAAHYGLAQILPLDPREICYKSMLNLPDLPLIEFRKDRFFAKASRGKIIPDQPLYLYYYGDASLLRNLPAKVGQWIFSWLAKGQPGAYRNLLAPILLTRADLDNPMHGSGLVDLYEPARIWLVRPGQPWNSFDLIPYAAG